jgi:hypothetical protein
MSTPITTPTNSFATLASPQYINNSNILVNNGAGILFISYKTTNNNYGSAVYFFCGINSGQLLQVTTPLSINQDSVSININQITYYGNVSGPLLNITFNNSVNVSYGYYAVLQLGQWANQNTNLYPGRGGLRVPTQVNWGRNGDKNFIRAYGLQSPHGGSTLYVAMGDQRGAVIAGTSTNTGYQMSFIFQYATIVNSSNISGYATNGYPSYACAINCTINQFSGNITVASNDSSNTDAEWTLYMLSVGS